MAMVRQMYLNWAMILPQGRKTTLTALSSYLLGSMSLRKRVLSEDNISRKAMQ
jgi:hypothetical protein